VADHLEREGAQALVQRVCFSFEVGWPGGMEAAEENELVAGLHDAAATELLAERTQTPADPVLLDPRRPVGGCVR
jgi:hypothetical protein